MDRMLEKSETLRSFSEFDARSCRGNDRACVGHLPGQDSGDRQTAQPALKKTWGTQMMQSKITQFFLM